MKLVKVITLREYIFQNIMLYRFYCRFDINFITHFKRNTFEISTRSLFQRKSSAEKGFGVYVLLLTDTQSVISHLCISFPCPLLIVF